MIIYNRRNQVLSCIHAHPHSYARDRACAGACTNLENFYKFFQYKVKIGRFLRLKKRLHVPPKGGAALTRSVSLWDSAQCQEGDRPPDTALGAIAHHLSKIKTPFPVLRGRGVVSYFCKLLIISCRQT
ncbi:hypothetical protein SAMD00079811_38310 [Scytonema sp. HK-05]|nr:hypothetical protein SAMD00079811_38310 [Scytonema sp. HK-05]